MVLNTEVPRLFIHGDARPVANALFGTGQCIKQCGLTAIRITDKTDNTFTHFGESF